MQKTSVYRHFNAEGQLLYVGVSLSALARQIEHARDSSWFANVVRIDIEWHPSRVHALYAEAIAIRDEKPLHNVNKPFPQEPGAPEENDNVRTLEETPWATLPPTTGLRTIAYTILPQSDGVQAEVERIAASITDGFGLIIADVEKKGDGFIRMFQLAQMEGTRILTDRPDAFSEEARALISKRGMHLCETARSDTTRQTAQAQAAD